MPITERIKLIHLVVPTLMAADVVMKDLLDRDLLDSDDLLKTCFSECYVANKVIEFLEHPGEDVYKYQGGS